MIQGKRLEYATTFWNQWLLLDKLYSDYARSVGLNALQLGVLDTLLQEETPWTQKKIAERCSNQKQAVNLVIRSLLENGYVLLQESPTDRRNKIVTLTEAGRTYARGKVLPFWQAEERALTGMSLEECRQLAEALKLYTEAMTRSLKEGGEQT